VQTCFVICLVVCLVDGFAQQDGTQWQVVFSCTAIFQDIAGLSDLLHHLAVFVVSKGCEGTGQLEAVYTLILVRLQTSDELATLFTTQQVLEMGHGQAFPVKDLMGQALALSQSFVVDCAVYHPIDQMRVPAISAHEQQMTCCIMQHQYLLNK